MKYPLWECVKKLDWWHYIMIVFVILGLWALIAVGLICTGEFGYRL